MQQEMTVHATSIEVDGQGALIVGPSGSGKSALALSLIALGARLISDDQTRIIARESALFACPPERLHGVIEARFVGLLRAPVAPITKIALVIDMAQSETQRLPPQRSMEMMDVSLPLLHKAETQHFKAAVLAYLKHGPYE